MYLSIKKGKTSEKLLNGVLQKPCLFCILEHFCFLFVNFA